MLNHGDRRVWYNEPYSRRSTSRLFTAEALRRPEGSEEG